MDKSASACRPVETRRYSAALIGTSWTCDVEWDIVCLQYGSLHWSKVLRRCRVDRSGAADFFSEHLLNERHQEGFDRVEFCGRDRAIIAKIVQDLDALAAVEGWANFVHSGEVVSPAFRFLA